MCLLPSCSLHFAKKYFPQFFQRKFKIQPAVSNIWVVLVFLGFCVMTWKLKKAITTNILLTAGWFVNFL